MNGLAGHLTAQAQHQTLEEHNAIWLGKAIVQVMLYCNIKHPQKLGLCHTYHG